MRSGLNRTSFNIQNEFSVHKCVDDSWLSYPKSTISIKLMPLSHRVDQPSTFSMSIAISYPKRNARTHFHKTHTHIAKKRTTILSSIYSISNRNQCTLWLFSSQDKAYTLKPAILQMDCPLPPKLSLPSRRNIQLKMLNGTKQQYTLTQWPIRWSPRRIKLYYIWIQRAREVITWQNHKILGIAVRTKTYTLYYIDILNNYTMLTF